MKTLGIFYTLFIISVIVNKTMITFPNTLNYSFTEKNYIVLRGGFSYWYADELWSQNASEVNHYYYSTIFTIAVVGYITCVYAI